MAHASDDDPLKRSPDDYDVSDTLAELEETDTDYPDPEDCDQHEAPWLPGDMTTEPVSFLIDIGRIDADFTKRDELHVCDRCKKVVSERTYRRWEAEQT